MNKWVMVDVTSRAITFDMTFEVLDYLNYADRVRVGIQLRALTGCRGSELKKMKWTKLFPLDENHYVLYWKPGKNQKTPRKEILPAYFVEELKEYGRRNKVPYDRLVAFDGNTLRRYFNRDVRPYLSHNWHAIMPFPSRPKVSAEEFVYSMSGFRKTFQTHAFYQEWIEWKDATVALEKVSKRMRHSSARLTCNHYIENMPAIDIERYGKMSMCNILNRGVQSRIMDY